MLIPRFSLRWILSFTTVLGVLFVVVRQAFLQQTWAIAFSAAVGLLVAIFLTYGVLFMLAYGLAKATRTLSPTKKPSNPFIVEGQYPPQMVPKSTFGGEQE